MNFRLLYNRLDRRQHYLKDFFFNNGEDCPNGEESFGTNDSSPNHSTKVDCIVVSRRHIRSREPPNKPCACLYCSFSSACQSAPNRCSILETHARLPEFPPRE